MPIYTDEELKQKFANKAAAEITEAPQASNQGTKAKNNEGASSINEPKATTYNNGQIVRVLTDGEDDEDAKDKEAKDKEKETKDEMENRVVANFRSRDKNLKVALATAEEYGLDLDHVADLVKKREKHLANYASGIVDVKLNEEIYQDLKVIEAGALLKGESQTKTSKLAKDFSFDTNATDAVIRSLKELRSTPKGHIDRNHFNESTQLGKYSQECLSLATKSGAFNSLANDDIAKYRDSIVMAIPVEMTRQIDAQYKEFAVSGGKNLNRKFDFSQSYGQDGANAGTLQQRNDLLQPYNRNILFLDQTGVTRTQADSYLQITQITAGQSASTPIEGANATDTSLNFNKISVNSTRAQVTNSITLDLFSAGGTGTNNYTDIMLQVMRDGLPALEEVVNSEYIIGTGTGARQLGLLALPNTLSYTLAAAPQWTDITKIEAAEYAAKSMYLGKKGFSFASNQNAGQYFKSTLKFGASATAFNSPILEDDEINTYPWIQSDLFPVNLGATTNQSPVFFADHSRNVVAQFLNVFVIIDYASQIAGAKVAINLIKYYGFGYRRPASILKTLYNF